MEIAISSLLVPREQSSPTSLRSTGGEGTTTTTAEFDLLQLPAEPSSDFASVLAVLFPSPSSEAQEKDGDRQESADLGRSDQNNASLPQSQEEMGTALPFGVSGLYASSELLPFVPPLTGDQASHGEEQQNSEPASVPLLSHASENPRTPDYATVSPGPTHLPQRRGNPQGNYQLDPSLVPSPPVKAFSSKARSLAPEGHPFVPLVEQSDESKPVFDDSPEIPPEFIRSPLPPRQNLQAVALPETEVSEQGQVPAATPEIAPQGQSPLASLTPLVTPQDQPSWTGRKEPPEVTLSAETSQEQSVPFSRMPAPISAQRFRGEDERVRMLTVGEQEFQHVDQSLGRERQDDHLVQISDTPPVSHLAPTPERLEPGAVSIAPQETQTDHPVSQEDPSVFQQQLPNVAVPDTVEVRQETIEPQGSDNRSLAIFRSRFTESVEPTLVHRTRAAELPQSFAPLTVQPEIKSFQSADVRRTAEPPQPVSIPDQSTESTPLVQPESLVSEVSGLPPKIEAVRPGWFAERQAVVLPPPAPLLFPAEQQVASPHSSTFPLDVPPSTLPLTAVESGELSPLPQPRYAAEGSSAGFALQPSFPPFAAAANLGYRRTLGIELPRAHERNNNQEVYLSDSDVPPMDALDGGIVSPKLSSISGHLPELEKETVRRTRLSERVLLPTTDACSLHPYKDRPELLSPLSSPTPQAQASPSPFMNRIAQEVATHLDQGKRQVVIELEPQELGRLHIDLVVEGETVQVRIVTEAADVSSLIQNNLSELKQALQLQNLELGAVSVDINAWEGRGGERQNFPQDSQQQLRSNDGGGSEARTFPSDEDGTETLKQLDAPQPRSGVNVWA